MSVTIPTIRKINFDHYTLREGVVLKRGGIIRTNKGEFFIDPDHGSFCHAGDTHGPAKPNEELRKIFNPDLNI